MRCERRWSRWVAVAALVLASVACGDGDDVDAEASSAGEELADRGSTTTEGRTDDPDDDGGDGEDEEDEDDDRPPVADADPAGFSVEELCERLAEVDLGELFSEELDRADPGTGDDDGCAYASSTTDGDIASDVDAMVTVARTASRLEDDTVAGEAGGGLPDLERLPALGDQGAIRAFRTQNEYVDTWEAWVFLALDEGLLRIQARDPDWDDRDDAVEATLELLEELDVPTT